MGKIMFDKSSDYDTMNLSAEDAEFLCKLSPQVCAKDFTVSSAEHRTGAILLEGRNG